MKAAVRSKYGSPDDISISEVEKPTPKKNDVLIKVYATTVNRTDYAILKGKPFIMKFFTGLLKPRLKITGTDFAGKIETVGNDVTTFGVGDRVMGFGGLGLSSHTEYLLLPQTADFIKIPGNLSYEAAAASIEVAFYAYEGVRYANPAPGQKGLLNGATGAIGSAMLQLLKLRGMHITAVCAGEQKELVRSLGADRIIDYRIEDFRKDSEQYDFVFDAVGKSTFGQCKPLLKKNGIYTSTDGLVNFLLTATTWIFGGKKVIFRAPKNVRRGLTAISELLQKGNFRPLIDRTYPLDKIVEAYQYVGSGQKIGNVVITIATEVFPERISSMR